MDDDVFQALVQLAFSPAMISRGEAGFSISSLNQVLMGKGFIKISDPLGTADDSSPAIFERGDLVYALVCTPKGYKRMYQEPLRLAFSLIKEEKVKEACTHAVWKLNIEQLPALLANEHFIIREAAQNRLSELI